MGKRARRAMDRVFGQRFVQDGSDQAGNGWLDEIEAGRATVEEAALAQSHGIAPDHGAPQPSYACRAFAADCEAALDGVQCAMRRQLGSMALSRGEHDRLLAAGVPQDWLANLNIAGDLGTARVSISGKGDRFEFGGPDPRLLLGVRDRAFELWDMVALASHDENRWSLLHGYEPVLGGWMIDAAHEAAEREVPFKLRLFSTPWDWLRGAGRGVCVLDWGGSALAELRALRGDFVTLVVDAGAREALREKMKHGGLPLVAEAEDLSRLPLAERIGRRAANG